MARLDVRQLGGGREQVVHERARQHLAPLVIDQLLEKRAADALRNPAMHLAVYEDRVDDPAAIVHDGVAQDLELPGLGVDLDDATCVALPNAIPGT